MAITYSEDGSVKKRKGNKKAIAMNAGPSTPIKYDKGIKIIKDTSQGRRDRLRRMKNFHRDMFPPV